MESDLIIGIRLGVIGFSLTFLALCLLILVILLLLRLFPDESETGQTDPNGGPTKAEDVDERRLEEMAVALAVGICLLERDGALEYQDPSLGKLLEQ